MIVTRFICNPLYKIPTAKSIQMAKWYTVTYKRRIYNIRALTRQTAKYVSMIETAANHICNSLLFLLYDNVSCFYSKENLQYNKTISDICFLELVLANQILIVAFRETAIRGNSTAWTNFMVCLVWHGLVLVVNLFSCR